MVAAVVWIMKKIFSNSSNSASCPGQENTVRGCLFVARPGSGDNFLFVFRRRDFDVFNASDNSGPHGRFPDVPEFAPPKNKKENVRWASISINRQPLTGFGPGSLTRGPIDVPLKAWVMTSPGESDG